MKTETQISTDKFLDTFVELNKTDKRFCWILGSGASRQSNIPMGRELVKAWIQDLYTHSKSTISMDEWVNDEFKDIPGFNSKTAVNYWPSIYQRRYRNSPESGYAFLENLLEKAEMSIGYAALAQILGGTPHNLGITTYFDSLLLDAVNIFTEKRPFDCDDESLPNYVTLNLGRPILARLHRDIFLTPKRDKTDVTKLPAKWETPLRTVFSHYTPIIIGFGDTGGSGGSLVRFLETLPTVPNGLFWCYREKPGFFIADEVRALVEHHNGQLVPIAGFDELMLQMWPNLSLSGLTSEIHTKYMDLAKNFQRKLSDTATRIIEDAKVSDTETWRSAATAARAVVDQITQDGY